MTTKEDLTKQAKNLLTMNPDVVREMERSGDEIRVRAAHDLKRVAGVL